MRKIAVLVGLVVITSFLLSGTVSAAPKGKDWAFQFEGTFSETQDFTDARLEFTGRGDIWAEEPTLGKMKGTLVTGLDGKPGDEFERNLWVKPEGEIGIKSWDDGFGECVGGTWDPKEVYSAGQDRWTIISVGADELHGTGELWWSYEVFCKEGIIFGEDNGWAIMRAALVGGQTAGLFRLLEGPEPGNPE